jgi:DNA polymerase-3 subunit delta
MKKNPSFSQWLNRLESSPGDSKEKIVSLYHFTGDEGFLKEEAWKKIASILVPEDLRSFNLDLLYGAETSADKIINAASTLPVNAPRRVVVVFDVDKLSAFSKEVLISYLPKLPDSACLILLSPKIPSKSKFYNTLDKLATTVECNPLWESHIPAWIEKRVSLQGKRIEKKAAYVLLDLVGNQLSDLVQEIDKLVIYSGEEGTITATQVKSAAGLSRAHNVFQLIDSIGARDCQRSLIILSNLVSAGEKPGGLIFWLTNHLEKLILTKQFTPGQGKSLVSYLKTKPFLASKYQNQAQNFSVEELERGLILLYQADVDLKSNLMPEKTLLELLAYNLCHL